MTSRPNPDTPLPDNWDNDWDNDWDKQQPIVSLSALDQGLVDILVHIIRCIWTSDGDAVEGLNEQETTLLGLILRRR